MTNDDDIATRLEHEGVEQKQFRTRTVRLGPSLVGDVSNIGELLAIAECEGDAQLSDHGSAGA